MKRNFDLKPSTEEKDLQTNTEHVKNKCLSEDRTFVHSLTLSLSRFLGWGCVCGGGKGRITPPCYWTEKLRGRLAVDFVSANSVPFTWRSVFESRNTDLHLVVGLSDWENTQDEPNREGGRQRGWGMVGRIRDGSRKKLQSKWSAGLPLSNLLLVSFVLTVPAHPVFLPPTVCLFLRPVETGNL